MLFHKDRYQDLPTVIFGVCTFKLNQEKKRFEFETNDTDLCKTLKDMGYSVEETKKKKSEEPKGKGETKGAKKEEKKK